MCLVEFAHVLEQFECAFYTQALSQFQSQDFIDAGFQVAEVAVQQFQSIQFDESSHVSILEVLESLSIMLPFLTNIIASVVHDLFTGCNTHLKLPV